MMVLHRRRRGGAGSFVRLFLFLVVLFLLLVGTVLVFAASAEEEPVNGNGAHVEDLQKAIEERGAELEKLAEERGKLEGELNAINQTQSGLRRDIGRIDYNLRQLELSIRSSSVTIDKLGLEVESLQDKQAETEEQIVERKRVLGKLMARLYERERDSFLVVFLRHPTLADGVGEVQSILSLNNDFAVSISELRVFQNELARTVSTAEQKRVNQKDEQRNLEYRQAIAGDQRGAKQAYLVQTADEEREYERQIAELDVQQQQISSVIDEIEEQLRLAFDPALLPLKRAGVLAYPVQSSVMTQEYGATAFAQRAYKSKFHSGVDFGIGLGTPVYAADDGVVRASDNNDRGSLRWQKYQYGRYVVINHDNNLSTLYAHLSKNLVSVGERVTRGQLIGYSGNTGYSTGPHLHFSVYWTASVQYKKIAPAAGLVPVGVTIDPQDYL